MYYNLKQGSKKTGISNLRFGIFTVIIMAAIVMTGGLTPTFAKGGVKTPATVVDNKETVTSLTPACASTTIDPTREVVASQVVDFYGNLVYTLSPLDLRGTLTNCSSTLQAYYITFDETFAGTDDILGQKACTIGTNWESVGDFIVKGDTRTGWSRSITLPLAGMPDVTTCLGLHTVKASVVDRADGKVLFTTNTTYNVVLK